VGGSLVTAEFNIDPFVPDASAPFLVHSFTNVQGPCNVSVYVCIYNKYRERRLHHIPPTCMTSVILFDPFTIESTTGKTFEKLSNKTCLIPSL